MKSKGTKRERFEKSKSLLREGFAPIAGGDTRATSARRLDAKEILASAWEQAGEITEFALKYFKHYMTDEKTGEFIPPAKFHQELYELLLTEQFAAVAAPREHAKSTIVSLIFPVYCICEKLRRFIVLISDSQPQARLLLGAVKAELEDNDKLRTDYGDLVPHGDGAKWAEEDIVTTTGIRVSARGAGQSLRGLRQRAARPDLVIVDDLENDEAVENPESRKKLMQWFKRAVLNLGKSCQFLVIGTILHHDSLLANLLKPDAFKRFVKQVYQAVDEAWTEASVLWPARWPLEALKLKFEDIGPADFDQEFRNRPVSVEAQTFKEDWFERWYYTDADIQGRQLRIVTGFDPAIKQRQKADLFAEATIGVAPDGTIFVKRAQGQRIPFSKQVDRVIEVYGIDQPSQVGIETIAYQEALKQEVDRRSREDHLYIPIVELTPHSDKIMRIASDAPLIENGIIRFRRDQQEAVRQYIQFPKADHDDIPDIINQLVSMVRKIVKAASGGSDPKPDDAPRRKSIWETAPQRARTPALQPAPRPRHGSAWGFITGIG
jgi:predicted phage terminase large subunit-like protein